MRGPWPRASVEGPELTIASVSQAAIGAHIALWEAPGHYKRLLACLRSSQLCILYTITQVPSAQERADSRDDDPLACSICHSADASDENPVIKCDGTHQLEVGFHLDCLPEGAQLDEIPEDDWFCPQCRTDGVWQADSMRDKKTMVGADGRARVHYLVHWTGYASEDDTWEPLSNLPQQGARQLVNTYNAKLRTAQRG